MDITIGTVCLAVLPALVTAGGMWLIFNKTMKEQREIEKRRRQIEIESEPLIKLRKQIASISSYMFVCHSILTLQELYRKVEEKGVRRGGTPRRNEGIGNLVKLACGNEMWLAKAKDFHRALYQVDDEEITREAEQVIGMLVDAWSTYGDDLKAEQREETKQVILHIQSLINKRLIKIGYKDGVSKQ